jgi:hypothetical protein
MGLPMMFLTFCNFSIKTELILFAPQPQGHITSRLEKFLLKSPIGAHLVHLHVDRTKPQTTKAEKLPKELIGFLFS